MSQEFIGNTVGASKNVNMNATNSNLQDIIREMDRLLHQRLRPMQERLDQLEEISLEGQLSQRRGNSQFEEEYNDEVYDEQAYNTAELQHYIKIEDMVHMAIKVERQLKQNGTTHFPNNSTSKWGQSSYKRNSSFQPKESSGPSKINKPDMETSKGKTVTFLRHKVFQMHRAWAYC
ncbi:hypothetical protein V6N13_024329 [Hibiscus sabdariffa]